MGIIMHRYFFDTLLEHLMSMFSLNVHVHNYNTRHNQSFHQSKVTSQFLFLFGSLVPLYGIRYPP